jgi:hypothetical protein
MHQFGKRDIGLYTDEQEGPMTEKNAAERGGLVSMELWHLVRVVSEDEIFDPDITITTTSTCTRIRRTFN